MKSLRNFLAIFLACAAFVDARAQTPAPADHDKLLKALRQKVAEERANTPAAAEVRKPAKAARAAKKKEQPAPAKSKPAAPAAMTPPAKAPEAAAVPAAPEQPAAPKTKQERLQALLTDYKADKITPREYHEQRVKILAEP
jgi:hypothetical protein